MKTQKNKTNKDIFQSLRDKAIPARYQSSIIPAAKGMSSTVIKRCLSSSTYNGTLTVCSPLVREETYKLIFLVWILNSYGKSMLRFTNRRLSRNPRKKTERNGIPWRSFYIALFHPNSRCHSRSLNLNSAQSGCDLCRSLFTISRRLVPRRG